MLRGVMKKFQRFGQQANRNPYSLRRRGARVAVSEAALQRGRRGHASPGRSAAPCTTDGGASDPNPRLSDGATRSCVASQGRPQLTC